MLIWDWKGSCLVGLKNGFVFKFQLVLNKQRAMEATSGQRY